MSARLLPNPWVVERRFRCLAFLVAGVLGLVSLVYGALQLRLLWRTSGLPQETIAELEGWGTLPDLILCGESALRFAYADARVPAPLCQISGRCSGLQHKRTGELASGQVDLGIQVYENFGGLCGSDRVLFLHTSRLQPSFGSARGDVLRHGRRNPLQVVASYADSSPGSTREDAWDGLALFAISGDYFSGIYTAVPLAWIGSFSARSLIGEVTLLSLEKVKLEDFRGITARSGALEQQLQREGVHLAKEASDVNTSELLHDGQQLLKGHLPSQAPVDKSQQEEAKPPQEEASGEEAAPTGSPRPHGPPDAEHLLEERVTYRSSNQVPVRVRNPWVPDRAVASVDNRAADTFSSSSSELRVVSFEVTVDKATVTVVAKVGRFQRLMGLVGSVGGYLAGLGSLFGCCFVRRHQGAQFAQAYEELTLRGCCNTQGDPLLVGSPEASGRDLASGS